VGVGMLARVVLGQALLVIASVFGRRVSVFVTMTQIVVLYRACVYVLGLP
jgi:hypothetical protein